MRRILVFFISCLLLISGSSAATRDGNTAARAKNNSKTNQRLSTSTTRNKSTSVTVSARATKAAVRQPTVSRSTSVRTPTDTTKRASQVTARATTPSTTTSMSQTRTGAEYEQCKNAYFTCMDQFCSLKNDDYRRCSCSNRVFDLSDARKVLNDAGDELTVFNENLSVVGMTTAQATAMKTASDGEKALSDDKSASKALLEAIMNSIRGKDTNVGGKYTELNSINLSFDTANAFGTMDTGQAIASYNGQNLYNAVYPQCRNAVREDCNDASLQRAVTAYLMAVEQDCNTVQTAIESNQKQLKSAIREGGAMLDLARIENRQKHNSSDFTTCMNNVEKAILSEQVCGADYHKCLDNGEYIDIETGKPIAGVSDFYKLEELLKFSTGIDAANQKLSKISNNRNFVKNFENKTKKFASDALDKCVEIADDVWAEYLDKAMLSIYYAQRAKVSEIRQGCFDFVSACYMNGDQSLTNAMKELLDDSGLSVQPDRIALNSAMCTNYVKSCNNMFDDDIIAQYINRRQDTDIITACRAVAKQCFDSFGGSGYENYYYPYSGIFTPNKGNAPDWFTLYEIISKARYNELKSTNPTTSEDYDPNVNEFFEDPSLSGVMVRYVSTCAKQLQDIEACNDIEIIKQTFGGLDKAYVDTNAATNNFIGRNDKKDTTKEIYGTYQNNHIANRHIRPTGVATEVYNQVIDILSTQCTNLQGRFIEYQYVTKKYNPANLCKANFKYSEGSKIEEYYGVMADEDMCPRNYLLSVDVPSWGACSCWENGARRSKNGTSAKCVAVLPTNFKNLNDTICGNSGYSISTEGVTDETSWCTRRLLSDDNQVCPLTYSVATEEATAADGTTQENTTIKVITTQGDCNNLINGNTEIPDGVSM